MTATPLLSISIFVHGVDMLLLYFTFRETKRTRLPTDDWRVSHCVSSVARSAWKSKVRSETVGNAVRSSNTTQSCRGDSLLLTTLAQTLGQSLSGWAASASGHIQPYSRGYRIFASIPRSCLNHLASLQHRQLFRLMKGECFSSSKLDSQTQLAGSVMCLCLLKTLRS